MMDYSPTVTAATSTVAWAGRASTFPRERAPRVSRRRKPLLKRGRWRAPLNCIICPISPGRNGSGRGLPPGARIWEGGVIPGVAPSRYIVLNRGGQQCCCCGDENTRESQEDAELAEQYPGSP